MNRLHLKILVLVFAATLSPCHADQSVAQSAISPLNRAALNPQPLPPGPPDPDRTRTRVKSDAEKRAVIIVGGSQQKAAAASKPDQKKK